MAMNSSKSFAPLTLYFPINASGHYVMVSTWGLIPPAGNKKGLPPGRLCHSHLYKGTLI